MAGTLATLLQGVLVLIAGVLAVTWWRTVSKATRRAGVRAGSLVLGFITNFFDTLGIGSFAPTTAWIKLRRLIPDEAIPGTLNIGHALPTVAQAVIFIALVQVDAWLLWSCVLAAALGAWFGAGIAARLPVQPIRIIMGTALLVGAVLFSAANLGWLPAGGNALGLPPGLFAVAVVAHLILGALMTLGIGLYAPSLILLSLLGLDPKAAFPIMMGACALLMPVGSLRFLRGTRWSHGLALGLAIGGLPGVLTAAYVVKSLSLDLLRWLVVIVVSYAAVVMLRAAFNSRVVASLLVMTIGGLGGMSDATAANLGTRQRIAMLQPRQPERLNVYVDVSRAGLLPGAENLRARGRGSQLQAALAKEEFDLSETLALQVSAALPEVGLQRVA
jgi:uncharacterized membrane protein YfcA